MLFAVSPHPVQASVQPVPGTPPPFEAIHRDFVNLPAGVMPWAPNWAPDGVHIVFHDYNNSAEWFADANGGNARCLSCGWADRPAITGTFTYVFPDNRRMLLANELGDAVDVLECAPSLFGCSQHQYLPVDLSADTIPPAQNLGRRTYHLAPDGVHLAYSMVRTDALIMMISELQRTATGYAAVNHRVINPPGPSGPTDFGGDGWTNWGQLYEFKSFADSGRSALIVGEPADGRVAMLKVDLATGATTRLSGNLDWNEDGGIAPDGSSLVLASWRSMNRLTVFGMLPMARPFFMYPLGAAIAIHYVSSHQGFACDLQPWLLGAEGDRGGALMGQPIDPYRAGNDIAGNNLAGAAFWSPDSTRILVQERQLTPPPAGANPYVAQKGTAPSRLLVARLDRTPTAPPPVVSSAVGAWAPTPAAFQGAYGKPHVATISGAAGGTALVQYGGNIAAGQYSVAYRNFSDDGKDFLSGIELVTGSPVARLEYQPSLTTTDATGAQTGFMRGTWYSSRSSRRLLPVSRRQP
jgi:hypothetical protein